MQSPMPFYLVAIYVLFFLGACEFSKNEREEGGGSIRSVLCRHDVDETALFGFLDCPGGGDGDPRPSPSPSATPDPTPEPPFPRPSESPEPSASPEPGCCPNRISEEYEGECNSFCLKPRELSDVPYWVREE